MDYINVCGCMEHWEVRGKEKEVPMLCFPLSSHVSLRTWAPFVFFTSVSILCWELFILLSVSCFSSSRQGNTDAELIQGERGRWRKRRTTTSISESFLPVVAIPYLRYTVVNAVQSLSSAKPNLSPLLWPGPFRQSEVCYQPEGFRPI